MRYKGCQFGEIPSEIMGQWQETFHVGAIHYCDFHHGYYNHNRLSYYMIMKIPFSSYCKKQKLQQIKWSKAVWNSMSGRFTGRVR